MEAVTSALMATANVDGANEARRKHDEDERVQGKRRANSRGKRVKKRC